MVTVSVVWKNEVRRLLQVIVDDEPFRVIHTAIFTRRPKLPNADTLESFTEQFEKLELQLAREYAFRRLSEREHSVKGLEGKMQERQLSTRAIEAVIHECTEKGYLSDERYAEILVRHKQAQYGPKRLAMILKTKGIDQETIEGALQKSSSETERDAIEKLLNTKYQKRVLSDYKERHKVFAALMRKGFNTEAIREALDLKGA